MGVNFCLPCNGVGVLVLKIKGMHFNGHRQKIGAESLVSVRRGIRGEIPNSHIKEPKRDYPKQQRCWVQGQGAQTNK